MPPPQGPGRRPATSCRRAGCRASATRSHARDGAPEAAPVRADPGPVRPPARRHADGVPDRGGRRPAADDLGGGAPRARVRAVRRRVGGPGQGRPGQRVRGAVPPARGLGTPLRPYLLPGRAHRGGPDRRGLRPYAPGDPRRQRPAVVGPRLSADHRPPGRRVLGQHRHAASNWSRTSRCSPSSAAGSRRPPRRAPTPARTSAPCTRPSSRWPSGRSARCPSAGRPCCGTPPSRTSRPADIAPLLGLTAQRHGRPGPPRPGGPAPGVSAGARQLHPHRRRRVRALRRPARRARPRRPADARGPRAEPAPEGVRALHGRLAGTGRPQLGAQGAAAGRVHRLVRRRLRRQGRRDSWWPAAPPRAAAAGGAPARRGRAPAERRPRAGRGGGRRGRGAGRAREGGIAAAVVVAAAATAFALALTGGQGGHPQAAPRSRRQPPRSATTPPAAVREPPCPSPPPEAASRRHRRRRRRGAGHPRPPPKPAPRPSRRHPGAVADRRPPTPRPAQPHADATPPPTTPAPPRRLRRPPRPRTRSIARPAARFGDSANGPTIRPSGRCGSWWWDRWGLRSAAPLRARHHRARALDGDHRPQPRLRLLRRARGSGRPDRLAARAVRFSVSGDATRLWTSDVVRGGDPAVPVHVGLTGGYSTLRLVVDPRARRRRARPRAWRTCADWADRLISC